VFYMFNLSGLCGFACLSAEIFDPGGQGNADGFISIIHGLILVFPPPVFPVGGGRFPKFFFCDFIFLLVVSCSPLFTMKPGVCKGGDSQRTQSYGSPGECCCIYQTQLRSLSHMFLPVSHLCLNKKRGCFLIFQM